MSEAQVQLLGVLIQLSVFGLVLALWAIALVIWVARRASRSRRIEGRLGLEPRAKHTRTLKLWRDGEVVTTSVEAHGEDTLGQRVEHLWEDAGWTAPVSSVILGVVGAALFAGLVVWTFTTNVLAVAAVITVVVMAFWTYLNHCIDKQAATRERQLLDALDLAARSLRAGHPLAGSFRIIAEEVPKPTGAVFQEICEKQGLGIGLDRALGEAAAESRSPDMKIFAAAVSMQMASGGNLAEMMERVAGVIRERVRLKRKARILTAEANLSKRVLIALPIFMFVILNILNKDYMQALYTTLPGMVMLGLSGVGLLLGSWVMNRMATLKY